VFEQKAADGSDDASAVRTGKPEDIAVHSAMLPPRASSGNTIWSIVSIHEMNRAAIEQG
jgi:hypothetical protein